MSNYTNLNKIVLYQTPMFNRTDTYLFESASARDTYFDNISPMKQITITDFHDLYEGCGIRLPYNYLELKKYNTMKLYYNDGLGHTQTYYCNVDNYLYESTKTCVPLYRIDYFLTYGYLLYHQNIDMLMERKTISEVNITKDMKADDVTIPRIKYTKKNTNEHLDEYYIVYPNAEHLYVILLNNVSIDNTAKNGINVSFYVNTGTDSASNPVNRKIDTMTIGCYVCLCNGISGLNYVLSHENNDYINQILEIEPMPYMSIPPYPDTFNSDNYYFFKSDLSLFPSRIEQFTYHMYEDYVPYTYRPTSTTNIYPNSDKKVMNWLNSRGIVVQDFEYDPKNFDDDDLVIPSNVDNVNYRYHAGLYFYTFLGNTYCYPLGYRGEDLNTSYCQKWTSGKTFSYTTDYQNSLAYKELQEYNSQQATYAIKNADIAMYYNNKLLTNQLSQIDVSKEQNLLSYRSQANTMNNQIVQLGYQETSNNVSKTTTLSSGILSGVGNLLTGNFAGLGGTAINTAGQLSSNYLSGLSINANKNLLSYQIDNLSKQTVNQNQMLDLQKEYNSINTQFQCDTIALSRDNTLANIAISNKYNNLKPGSSTLSPFEEITDYYYAEEIDTDNNTNYSQVVNIRTHYNIYGIYLGYIKAWIPGYYEGLYFDYIKGDMINNTNTLLNISGMNTEIFTQLSLRLTEGLRIWNYHKLILDEHNNYEHTLFGNLLLDNTMSNVTFPVASPGEYLPGPNEEQKIIYANDMYELMDTNGIDWDTYFEIDQAYWNSYNTLPAHPTDDEIRKHNYLNWLGYNVPFGEEPTGDLATDLEFEAGFIYITYHNDDTALKIIMSMNWLTLNQMRYMWYQYLSWKHQDENS